MEKTERFGLLLTPVEKQMLRRLSTFERLPAAAVIRRLIWKEVIAVENNKNKNDDPSSIWNNDCGN